MGGRSERKDGFSEDFARVLVQDKVCAIFFNLFG